MNIDALVGVTRIALHQMRAPRSALNNPYPLALCVRHWVAKNCPVVLTALKFEGHDPTEFFRALLVWLSASGVSGRGIAHSS